MVTATASLAQNKTIHFIKATGSGVFAGLKDTYSLDTSNTVQNLTATSKTLSHIQASDSLNDSEERLKKDPFYKFKKEMN